MGDGLYLFGVWRLHERGDHWPLGRTLAFVVGGMGSFFFATCSGIAAYDTTLLSVHMVQHMILAMVVPLFCALGAPVTLALRTLPRRPRGWLLGVLHSRFARGAHVRAPGARALHHQSLGALLLGLVRRDPALGRLHELMHVHLVRGRALFFTPILGIDPVPGRVSHPFRLLLLLLTLPFHAFLGVTIMGQSELIGGDWYPNLHDSMAWLPDPHADQHLAGGILWASGDLIGLVLFAVLFAQWVRASMQEGRREDRRLDRLERLERSSDSAQPGTQTTSGDAPVNR